MTLDEAIQQARASLAADSTIRISREALLLLIDHAAAGNALRDVYVPTPSYRPNAHVIRRLLERLDANTSWGVERLRDFDWGDAPVPTSTPPEAPTLHDQFMMAALTGIAAHPGGPVKHLGETTAQAHAHWARSCADAAMAARGTK